MLFALGNFTTPSHSLLMLPSPYHAYFMHTMLIRPTPEELESFGSPDWTIINAGEEFADPSVPVRFARIERLSLFLLGSDKQLLG